MKSVCALTCRALLVCVGVGFLLLVIPGEVRSQSPTPATPAAESWSPRNRDYGQDGAQPIEILLEDVRFLAPTIAVEEPDPTKATRSEEADPEAYQELVFQSYRDRTWEIYRAYTANSPSPNVAKLTANTAFDGEPRLDRGCRRIVFTSNRDGVYDIYAMDVTGANVIRLTQNSGANRSAYWSPDGARITFSSDRDGNREIYTMAADGSAQQRLTANSVADVHPAFSPDGTKIAWIRVLSDEHGAIIVADADGANEVQVGPALRFLGGVVWAPDGQRLAFDYDADGNGWNDLAVIDLNGANLRVIKQGGAQVDILLGSWSTTGGYLFASWVQYIQYQGNYYIQSIDTRKYHLTNGSDVAIFTNQLDLYPDAQPNDISIPTSSVRALPALSRVNNAVIHYDAWDLGPAVVRALELQQRNGTTGEWQPLATFLAENGAGDFPFLGAAGQTTYFRSRAQDHADHWEEWPAGDGDAWTTFYTWQFSGGVRDVRGVPLPGTTIDIEPGSLSPVISNPDGEYAGHLVATGIHTVTPRHVGYGALPPSAVDVFRDTALNSYLPDAASWLSNGDFEDHSNPLAGWSGSSGYSPTIVAGFTGANAVHLGPACAPPCLDAPEYLLTLDTSLDTSRVVLRVDLTNNVHVLFDRRYMWRNASGQWSSPVTLGDTADRVSQLAYTKPSLAVDDQGGLHAVTSGRYFTKPAGGNWSDGFTLKPGVEGESLSIQRTDLAVNAQGAAAIAYNSYDGYWGRWYTHFIYQSAGGSWTDPVSWYGRPTAALAATPDGRFHLFQAGSEELCHWVIPSDGHLQSDAPPAWCTSVGASDLRVVPGADGSLHLVAYARQLNYWRRDPVGSWTGPYAITPSYLIENPYQELSMAVDSWGAVHLVVATGDHVTPVRYYYLAPGGNTFHQSEIPYGEYLAPESLDLFIDRSGDLHLAQVEHLYTLSYLRSMRWPTSGRIELATPVTVPADAHRPTLAFMAATHGARPDKPSLTVSLGEGSETMTSTNVFTLTGSPQWQLGWTALDPWLGETVTVTFALTATRGQPVEHVWIDTVTAGEWWTPLVDRVAPHHLDAGVGGILTISGSNFPPDPVVHLGDLALENVALLDDVTIQATVPPSAPIGRYRIIVATPQGQSSASPDIVEVGEHVFLSLIRN
jgi:Tol biopolymer transport system component